MYLRSCTLCFLILIVTCCNGNFTEYVGVTSELVSVENPMFVGQDTSYVSSKVNINKIFDEILPKIRDFLIKNGLEPINLPNYTENILINGKIDLRNGFLHYMTDVKRSKNVMLQYRYKHIFLEIPLRWQLLDFNYNYDFTYLFIKKRGEAYGRVEDADFIVTLEIDLNKFQVILQEIKIHRIESFRLKIHTNKLDPLMNILSQAMTRIFQNCIIKLLEEKSIEIIQPFINEMNRSKKNYADSPGLVSIK
uniref:uncharacterized protein LOC127070670 n=1 Tax=Vespula vulgaris TaxID=7454 RepID=UPI002124AD39|nr:uncharacterized protein LOC127070670 [Vespula vulgaris]